MQSNHVYRAAAVFGESGYMVKAADA
jgi:hypothetical protein